MPAKQAPVTDEETESLREQWNELYRKTLPGLARAKDSSQPKWPVVLDHCFARIILDNTVGHPSNHSDEDDSSEYRQWDKVISKPAVRNMTTAQLESAIELGEKIKDGKVDLVELDENSLRARGKYEGKYGGKKRKQEDGDAREQANTKKKRKSEPKEEDIKDEDDNDAEPANGTKSNGTKSSKDVSSESKTVSKSPAKKKSKSSNAQSTLSFAKKDSRTKLEQDLNTTSHPDTEAILAQIRAHSMTPYRKRLYATLLTVPEGEYTTYQAMADHLGSSARAVGNGMRNNPFAPQVPCHRVLASDGSIGGFGGQWGVEGKHADKKVQLLKKEGVKFDSKGKVKGPVFRDFGDVDVG